MIDKIFNKLESQRNKVIPRPIIYYLLAQTCNYEEVKFLIEKIKYLNIKVNSDLYNAEMQYIEDYKFAIQILDEFNKYIIKYKKKTPINAMVYQYLIEKTDTLEDAKKVFEQIKKNNIKPTMGTYTALLERQETYLNARKMFDKYVMLPDRERIEGWKTGDSPDALKEVYGMLYIKAKSKDEIEEIRKDLVSVNMSTNIEDYEYLKTKTSIRRAELMRNVSRKTNYYIQELEYFFGDNKKVLNDNESSQSEKIKKITNLYKRNRRLVGCIKGIYDNKCQICGEKIDLGNRFYSEVHHIHSLHDGGPDIIENMIVLCPNHHILFDNGIIKIDLDNRTIKHINGRKEKIEILKHDISKQYVEFNNTIGIKDECKNINLFKTRTVNVGNTVILLGINNREEIKIDVNERKEDISYLEFKLLNHKSGDVINYDENQYVISSIY